MRSSKKMKSFLSKVAVDTNDYELGELSPRRIQPVTEETQSVQVIKQIVDQLKKEWYFIQISQTYENSGFVKDQIDAGSGVIITTKLQENDKEEEKEDDDDQNDNAGFEKLSGEGNKVGLVVLKLRDAIFQFIRGQKVYTQFLSKIISFLMFSSRRFLFIY